MTDENTVQLAINTIRTLSIDAVQQAKSGHPGTPMALAPLVYTIWNRVLRYDPLDPIWPNRDRFVLSNGHASMLLWSVLHLTGMHTFGASAPLKDLQKKFGFEPDQGVAVAKELLRQRGLRHPWKICADKTSVPTAGNQSRMTPAYQPNRHL